MREIYWKDQKVEEEENLEGLTFCQQPGIGNPSGPCFKKKVQKCIIELDKLFHQTLVSFYNPHIATLI